VQLWNHLSIQRVREHLSSLVGKQQELFRNAVSMCQRSFSGLWYGLSSESTSYFRRQKMIE
jgi:hypothetical protein